MKRKLSVIFALLLVLISTLIFAVACDKDKNKIDGVDDVPAVAGDEVGEYYCDVNGKEYLLTLTDECKFTLVLDGDPITGNYVPNGENLTFKIDGVDVPATYYNDAVSFTYNSLALNFIRKIDYKITFVTNGGSAVAEIFVRSGRVPTKPADPIMTNSAGVFVGWYTDNNTFRNEYDWSKPVTANVVLYARFVEPLDPEYTVTFNVDGATNVFEPVETLGHKLFSLPTPEKAGSTFVGWWTSDYGDATMLSYQYKEHEITKDITLYAVWNSDAPIVSADNTGISWTSIGTNVSYTVKVTNKDTGAVVHSATTSQLSDNLNFNDIDAGFYEITVTANGKTGRAHRINRALAPVKAFEVVGNYIYFNKVDNAEQYVLTIDCGTAGHHPDPIVIPASANPSYSFAGCAMKEGKITFTVTAQAYNYLESVSEPYYLTRTLDAVATVGVNTADDTITWTPVENATAYVVTITQDGVTDTKEVAANATISLKNYDRGNIDITVMPKALGWNSPAATPHAYNKTRLATPQDFYVNIAETKIIWGVVNGADGYVVKIGDVTRNVTDNFIVFTDDFVVPGATSYEITVQATLTGASDATSFVSEPYTIPYGVLSGLRYANGVVSWDPSFGINAYYFQINNGAVQSLGKVTQFNVGRFSAKGTYTYKLAANESMEDAISINVAVYELSFATHGADEAATIEGVHYYYATGDSVDVELPGADDLTRPGLIFNGWYTAAEGGVAFEGIYTATSDLTLHVQWAAKEYTITFNVGTIGVSTPESYTIKFLGSATLPVPASKDPMKAFAGWYDAAAGGIAYTNADGFIEEYQDPKDITLYAKWVDIFTFTEVPGGYQISKNSDIEHTNITVLNIPATYNGKNVIEVIDFTNCSKLEVVNIPESIRYISIAAAETAFTGCSRLREINITAVDGFNDDARYYSIDGVLFYINPINNNMHELKLYPVARPATSYDIPDGVQILPAYAIWDAAALQSVSIPASVTLLETRAIGVTAIAFSNSITSIAFRAATEGEDNVPLTIQEKAFFNVSHLSAITLPLRLKTFDLYTIIGGNSTTWHFAVDQLTSIDFVGVGSTYTNVDGAVIRNGNEIVYYIGTAREIVIGDNNGVYRNVTAISHDAFKGNAIISSVTIGRYVTRIGESAFYNCKGLTSVTFVGTADDNGLTISEHAFYGIGASGTLTLPSNLQVMGAHAFGDTGYTIVNLNSSASFAAGSFNSDDGVSNVTTVVVGADVSGVNFKEVFGSGISVIFSNSNDNYEQSNGDIIYTADFKEIVWVRSDLSGTITLDGRLERIGAETFKGTKITSITIPSTVTQIGTEAFANCTNLLIFSFNTASNGVEFGDRVFYGCTSLKSITLPEGTTRVGSQLFVGATKLSSVTLPASLEYIKTVPAGGGVPAYFGMFSLHTVYSHSSTMPDAIATLTVKSGNTHYKAVDNVLYSLRQEGGNYVEDQLLYGPIMNRVTSIVIPSTVTRIWPRAFAGPSKSKSEAGAISPKIARVSFANNALAPINDGESTLTIGQEAFLNCHALTGLTLPTSGGSVIIEGGAFRMTGLTSITIPDTVTRIGAAAFYCLEAKISSVSFEGNGTQALRLEDNKSKELYSGESIFYGTSAGDGWDDPELVLPERLTYIGAYAFNACKLFNKITIPANVTEIGESAFASTSSYIDTIEFAANSKLMKIGHRAFAGCGITSIVIPASVITIADQAFSSCAYLQSFVVEDNSNLVTLGDNSSSLTAEHPGVFYNCYKLTEVNFGANSRLTYFDELLFEMSTATSSVTGNLLNPSQLRSIVIPASVQRIGANAFKMCVNLELVTFESGSKIHIIGDYAFAGTGLTEFTFPETNSEIILGSKIFNNCTSLQTVNISSKVGELNDAFAGCTGITLITMANGNDNYDLYSLGEGYYLVNKSGNIVRSFGHLSGVLNIPENATFIGDTAFIGQTGITEVVIPASVRMIGANAFFGCTSLVSVTLQNHSLLVSIGENAFSGCTQLANFNFAVATNFRTLGENAFKDTALVSVDLGNSRIVELPGSAFAGCTELETLLLPYTLETLGGVTSGTVFGNSKLTVFDISATKVTALPANYFTGLTTLQTVILPATVTRINASAFEGCTSLTTLVLPRRLNLVVISGVVSDVVVDALSKTTIKVLNVQSVNITEGIATCVLGILEANGIEKVIVGTERFTRINAIDSRILAAIKEKGAHLCFLTFADYDYYIDPAIKNELNRLGFTLGSDWEYNYAPSEEEVV